MLKRRSSALKCVIIGAIIESAGFILALVTFFELVKNHSYAYYFIAGALITIGVSLSVAGMVAMRITKPKAPELDVVKRR